MERMATSYFKEVYTNDPTLTPKVVLECVTSKVTRGMNDVLCAPFSEPEVSDALFQIGPLKAPGTDGFPASSINAIGRYSNLRLSWKLLSQVLCLRELMIPLLF